jgi:hypothetical protein
MLPKVAAGDLAAPRRGRHVDHRLSIGAVKECRYIDMKTRAMCDPLSFVSIFNILSPVLDRHEKEVARGSPELFGHRVATLFPAPDGLDRTRMFQVCDR